ncbi:MAG: thioredoxin domain-containing protein [Oligoflexia bacterium]|nr:thioredoxin domain-containing protein [Oligoflexia bacterium]
MKSLKTDSQKIRLYALAGLSSAGFLLSTALSRQYYQIREGAAGFRTFCNINQTMNCDAVAASPYAELFAGIPLSSFAAGWYLAMLIVSLLALSREGRREGVRGLLALTGIATVFSIAYFVVMAAVIKTFCLFCLLIDGINLAALALVLSLGPESPAKAPLERARWKNLAWIVAGSLLVSVVMLRNFEGQAIDRATVMQTADSILSGTPAALASSAELPSLGASDAPITIVEFSDFQCPYCRVGALMLNGVLNRYPGKVRIVLRNYPLDPACNPAIQRSMHPAACEAAKTTVCAHKQGKFAATYEQLFEHQASLRPGRPAELAKDAGVNPEQLASCLNAPETSAAVTRDIEEGNRLGVQSTPTFFINGYKVEGAYALPVWSEVIDRLLKQKEGR